MKIVITGARGFVGSRIVRHALDAGIEVVGVDLPSSRVPHEEHDRASRVEKSASRPENDTSRSEGKTLRPPDGAAYTECLFDLLDPPGGMPSSFAGARAVIHCAARITGSPEQVVRTNVEGTKKLLALLSGMQARFVLLSSMAVEESHPGPYARSKKEAESLVEAKAPDFTLIRPAMIYGPGDPNWTRQIRRRVTEKKAILLPHGGRSRIQPLYVDDAARAILEAARSDEASQRIIPIGGPKPIPQIEFLRWARDMLNGRTRFISIPLWPFRLLGGVAGRKFAALAAFHGEDHRVDNTTAEQLLGFDPMDAREGLERTFRS